LNEEPRGYPSKIVIEILFNGLPELFLLGKFIKKPFTQDYLRKKEDLGLPT